MKRFLGVATVIGICALALAANAGNLNTSARCPGVEGRACEIGHSGSTSFEIVTDGGTVTIDGSITTAGLWVSAPLQIVNLTGGALTRNAVNVVSTATEVVISDCKTSLVGSWYTIVVRDHNETIEIRSFDSGDTIYYSGITAVAGDELDSPSEDGTTGGSSVTLLCTADDAYHSIATSGLWVDGGATD
jgi:hypothetical protein